MTRALLLALILVATPIAFAANPGHGADRISQGTFEAGNYSFPESLNITGELNVLGGNFSTAAITNMQPFYIQGTGYNTGGNRILRVGGTTIYDASGRGLRLTILNKTDLTVSSDATYDTYLDSLAANNLATALNNISSDQLGILTSEDAWESQITPALRQAFIRAGLSKAAVSTNTPHRKPYAAIFDPADNSETNNRAAECMLDSNENQTGCTLSGWIMDGSFTTTGSQPSALWNSYGTRIAVISDDNGNVGVGTTAPTYTLDINGTFFSGGNATFGGTVTLNQDPATAMEAATRQYVDNAIASASVTDVWVNSSGDAMSGTLDMGGNIITNIGNAGTDFNSGGGLTLQGALSTNGGSGTLTLRPGTSDHSYIQIFADSDSPNTRSGWIGFGTAGGTVLTIDNELGSIIDLLDEVHANSLQLTAGATINEFSTDGTLSGNSDVAVPTEAAVRTYVQANAGGDNPWTNNSNEVYLDGAYPADVNISGNLRLGNGTAGNATGAGDLYVTSDIEYDGNLYGPGADIAENVPADAEYAPGTVLTIRADGLLTKSTVAYDAKAAGIVTTAPGIILGKDVDGAAVALAGRVPVQANAQNGPIAPGDLLTTSETPGVAMKLSLLDPMEAKTLDDLKRITAENDRRRAAAIGKALAPLESGQGTIEALVTLG